jgi:hypothetical protein
MSSINRVYSTICLISAALAARGVTGGSGPSPESGTTISARDFKAVIERFSSISATDVYRVTFANVLMLAAPALLWNVKRRGFSGCIVKAAGNGMLLELRR